MTARPFTERRRWQLSAAVALVLLLAMAMAAGCMSHVPDDSDSVNHLNLISENARYTFFIANNSGMNGELDSYRIHNSTELPVPSEIKKYDIVRIDTRSLEEQLKSGKEITLVLKGKDYPMELSRIPSVNTANSDDDTSIVSYHGHLRGTQSDVMLFVSQNYLSGSVLLGGETYGIDFVSGKKGGEPGENLAGYPLHIIYNEKDVDYRNFSIDAPPHFPPAEFKQ
ncbi:hypothetical protein [Methanoregula sp. PtaU1.Bin006]|nr:hypothetical protein [Methanoregula sp. PtaU1.Bin006]